MRNLAITAILLLSATFSSAWGQSSGTKDSAVPKESGGQERQPAVALEPAAKGEPKTEMLDTANSPEHDPLLEPQPLPRASLSLIGGIARKVDMIHNRLTLQPFGGREKYVIAFDERTRITSGGRETTVLAIHPGDRVYADTQALGAQVFAKAIQVRTASGPAQASGQIIELLGGQVRMQDRLSGETVRFVLTDRTTVEANGAPSSRENLHTGSLVDVTYMPDARGEALSIAIHASPGESYIFAGKVTHVDLRDGVLALDNRVDGNNYELFFDPLAEKGVAQLVVGTPVSVVASFDGKRYRATSIKVTEEATSESSER